MPTVVDSLVVTLGLDPSGFQKGASSARAEVRRTRDETVKAAGEIEHAGAKASEFFNKIRNQAFALFALLAGAGSITSFANSLGKTTAALAEVSRNTGVATTEINALGSAVRGLGGEYSDALGDLQKLSAAQINVIRHGDPRHAGLQQFRLRGLHLDADPTKTLESIFEQAERESRGNNADRHARLTEAGLSESTIRLGMRDPAERARRMEQGRITGRAYAEAAELQLKVNEALEEVRQKLERLGLKVLPYLNDALVWLAKFLEDHQTEIAAVIKVLGPFIPAMIAATATLWLLAGLRALIPGFGRALPAAGAAAAGGAATGAAATGAAAGGSGLAAFASRFYAGVASGVGVGVAFDYIKNHPRLIQGMADNINRQHRRAADGEPAAPSLIGGTWTWNSIKTGLAADAGGIARGLGALGGVGAWMGNAANLGPVSIGGNVQAGANGAIEYFMSKGWTREQAAGIAANLHAESGFNPAAVGDGGLAYGVAQWHPPRQANFRQALGKDIRGSSTTEQYAFVDWELNNTERAAGDRLRKARTAEASGAIVSEFFERPRDTISERTKRGALAERFGAGYRPTAPAGSDVAPTAGGATPAASRGENSRYNSSEMNIGAITIHTAATDSDGIAREMARSLRQYTYVTQANTALG